VRGSAEAEQGQAAGRAWALLEPIYGRVYGLCLRMLLIPEDAEDAAQDIAIKILRGYGGFRGDSSFSTWAIAVASNHLLGLKARRIPDLSFEAYEAEVGAHADARSIELADGERAVLEAELKRSCTLGMLQCLDPLDRLVYVLDCFFRLSSAEGGKVAGLSPEAYRQRLSRTRRRMSDFMGRVCGLAGGPCSCAARLDYALAKGRVSRNAAAAATRTAPEREIEAFTSSMEDLDLAGTVFGAMETPVPAEAEERLKECILALGGPAFALPLPAAT
jgi:RNA polymerase sigma factor (sigma-70 family)